MVCESPRTHGNKTRISSIIESRIESRYAQRAIRPHRHTQPHLSSFSVCLHRRPQNHYPNASPPVIRVTALPRAHVCHTHTVYYPTPLPRPSISCVYFFHSSRPDFRLHPPSPAPRLHRPPAFGRRVSSHLFPRAYLRVPVI